MKAEKLPLFSKPLRTNPSWPLVTLKNLILTFQKWNNWKDRNHFRWKRLEIKIKNKWKFFSFMPAEGQTVWVEFCPKYKDINFHRQEQNSSFFNIFYSVVQWTIFNGQNNHQQLCHFFGKPWTRLFPRDCDPANDSGWTGSRWSAAASVFIFSRLQHSHSSSLRLQGAQQQKPWSRSDIRTHWPLILVEISFNWLVERGQMVPCRWSFLHC